MIALLLLSLLTQTPVTVTNRKADATAVATRCVNLTGTAFESCAGAAWVPDGGAIGTVTVTNFPQPDGGFIGIVSITGNVGVQQITSPWQTQNSNIDVALSTRTKPSDQQHVTIDTIDGGTTLDVSGSSVKICNPVYVLSRPNPFVPRCNKVRTQGCLP